MNTAKPFSLLILGSVMSFGLIGCKKMHTGVTPIPSAQRSAPEVGIPSGPVGGNPGGQDIGAGNRFPGGIDPNASNLATDIDGNTPLGPRDIEGNYILDREAFADQTVYFEFDSSVVSPDQKPKLEAVVSRLQTDPAFHLKVEGHCDERGTDEYNRALGERRALSIREYLIAMGISADRISTIRYGEDKPALFGSDELSWAKNRRGEFVLLIPKN